MKVLTNGTTTTLSIRIKYPSSPAYTKNLTPQSTITLSDDEFYNIVNLPSVVTVAHIVDGRPDTPDEILALVSGSSSGATGLQGITGLGAQGVTGIQGLTGLFGLQGITGFGLDGSTGLQGITGLQGQIGAQGITGIAASGSAIVYDRAGNISDSAIYCGTAGISGIGGFLITLPLAYSNANYKVQLSYNSLAFNPANAGFLYSQIVGNNQFMIFSSNAADLNNVDWLTTGSIVA